MVAGRGAALFPDLFEASSPGRRFEPAKTVGGIQGLRALNGEKSFFIYHFSLGHFSGSHLVVLRVSSWIVNEK